MPPLKGEEACEHVERVSAIAWANGAYKATEALEAENARLKAEVERLRKAGDAVCESPYLWEDDPAVIAWRAAKEGKQP
jgi:cell division protein FtsB